MSKQVVVGADAELIAKAMRISGTKTKQETIEMALYALTADRKRRQEGARQSRHAKG